MATVLVVDDDPSVRESLNRFFDRSGYDVVTAETGNDALDLADRHRPEVVVLDLGLPDISGMSILEQIQGDACSVVVLTGSTEIEKAVNAMKLGAENFLTKPVDLTHLSAVVDRAREKVELRRQVRLLRERQEPGQSRFGVSRRMRAIEEQIGLLAKSRDTTVLITGESGTGKGWVAQHIHSLSPRADRPFVQVNCASLTATFLDSELFGHEKGAFTDAKTTKQGLFEVADGGSLFLDEIGDMSLELQPKLLRVLEDKRFRRLGSTREIAVDVRLIAATNRDIVELVDSGAFRSDLYYRLSVMPIHIPPVREREKEDVMELIRHLFHDLSEAAPDAPKEASPQALERLLAYSWPGNVREIRNVLERSMILARGRERVELEHLPFQVRGRTRRSDRHQPRTLKQVEADHIAATLKAHHGNRTHAARELGISRATLIKKIKDYSLKL